jgi:hypothetical protein
MLSFKNKYQYKDYISDMISEFDVSRETFDHLFASVFLEIFEKEKQYPCFFNYFKISITSKIAEEIKKIKKSDKTIFLPLYEDYLKLNTELDDIALNIKKKCQNESGICSQDQNCLIDITKYPAFLRIIEHSDLESFKPDLISSQEFIEFFKENIGKFGIYFLYNLNKELLFVGHSLNLGETIIDEIWKKSIDGYVAVAFTNAKADMKIYEDYYILTEKPLKMNNNYEPDEVSVKLKLLKRTELVKIYSNN